MGGTWRRDEQPFVAEIAVELASARHEVRIRARAGACLRELVEAIDPSAIGLPVLVDGVLRPLDIPVVAAGLATGATLGLGGPEPPGVAERHLVLDAAAGVGALVVDRGGGAVGERPLVAGRAAGAGLGADAGWAVAAVGGLGAGATVSLGPGRYLLGRTPGCDLVVDDPSVSSHHAVVAVDAHGGVAVADLAPERPTAVDGRPVAGPTVVPAGALVRVGEHLVVVRPRAVTARAGPVPPPPTAAGATTGFLRPPRLLGAADVVPVVVPEHRDGIGAIGRVGLLSSMVTVVASVAAYVVTRSPLTLVFAAMGALATAATVVETARRQRRERRGEHRRLRQDVADLRRALAQQVDGARRRAWTDHPDLAALIDRAVTGDGRLWERRSHHADAHVLVAGVGAVPWSPVVEPAGGGRHRLLRDALDCASVLPDVPVTVTLDDGGVVGVVGPRSAALAVARALLVQASVLHGPADLTVVVASADLAAWDWTKWLPHAGDPLGGGARLLAGSADELDALLVDLPALSPAAAGSVPAPGPDTGNGAGAGRAGPRILVVLDGPELIVPRTAAVRSLLAGGRGAVSLLAVASAPARLPAECTAIVAVDGSGRATVTWPATGRTSADLLAIGCSTSLARRCAAAMARWHDPERAAAPTSLPSAVSLIGLLGTEATDGAASARAWAGTGPQAPPRAPIGVAADGVVELDLVRDGPHGLVGGTTGSGKSELLRTVVAALAVRCSPRDLTFVLVDYKGGAAFDQCARLPHTVGLVTDLDGHLAERALRSLDAELSHRERVLRAAGAGDLPAYLRLPVAREAPLPRLVVVIDEFATLAHELPDFLAALVGVAQRGRSLGVHLLLATQRPSGAVNDDIRANTNLRIALRVQDAADSSDVLDSPVAALLPRGRPGRLWLRFGPTELTAAQSARVTGPAPRTAGPVVAVEPFGAGRGVRPERDDGSHGAGAEAGPGEVTELGLLVAATTDAARRLGLAPPRRPWLEPLPALVPLAALPAEAMALADRPAEQAQPAVAWDPDDGNLLLYGMVGSGTTTALAAIALRLATGPAPRHLYVLDLGPGLLAPLAGLPTVGAVVGAVETERQWRLVRLLRAELDRRKAGGRSAEEGPAVPITVLVDGYGALAADHDDLYGQGLLDDLARLVTEGQDVGLSFALAAERPGVVPLRLASTIPTTWLFRLADAGDYAAHGLRARDLPTFVPGRAVVADTGTEIQLGHPGALPDAVAAATRTSAARPVPPPMPVGTLPATVLRCDLPPAQCHGWPWVVPVGIGDRRLAPAALVVHEGEHVLIAGPGRSGRTTALVTVAGAVAASCPGASLVTLRPRRSSLAAWGDLAPVAVSGTEELAAAVTASPPGRPVVVFVDDAELVDDDADALAGLIQSRRPGVVVVAAGHADALRLRYGHWTNQVRRSRTGLLLMPDPDAHGDLLSVALPRRSPAPSGPGRGYLVDDGRIELVQLAGPRAMATAPASLPTAALGAFVSGEVPRAGMLADTSGGDSGSGVSPGRRTGARRRRDCVV